MLATSSLLTSFLLSCFFASFCPCVYIIEARIIEGPLLVPYFTFDVLRSSDFLVRPAYKSTPTMARTKQVPVRRESSSEFFNKQTASWVDTDDRGDKLQVANGYTAAANGPASSSAKPEAGVVQLFISVAGIYASL